MASCFSHWKQGALAGAINSSIARPKPVSLSTTVGTGDLVICGLQDWIRCLSHVDANCCCTIQGTGILQNASTVIPITFPVSTTNDCVAVPIPEMVSADCTEWTNKDIYLYLKVFCSKHTVQIANPETSTLFCSPSVSSPCFPLPSFNVPSASFTMVTPLPLSNIPTIIPFPAVVNPDPTQTITISNNGTQVCFSEPGQYKLQFALGGVITGETLTVGLVSTCDMETPELLNILPPTFMTIPFTFVVSVPRANCCVSLQGQAPLLDPDIEFGGAIIFANLFVQRI